MWLKDQPEKTVTMKNEPEGTYSTDRRISNILVVDDSQLIRIRLKELLLESGINGRVWEAGNCSEAVSVFRHANADLVLLDLRLKNENGLTLIRPFKEINPEVKIVMLTNFPDELYRKKSFELGADFFFSKLTETEQALDTCLWIASCCGGNDLEYCK
jgi:DNA-binding NarL/FixJ family response regulator